jgi:hypothetical protein
VNTDSGANVGQGRRIFDPERQTPSPEERAAPASMRSWALLVDRVDVGGGDGTLLAAILQAHRQLAGLRLGKIRPVAATYRVIEGGAL